MATPKNNNSITKATHVHLSLGHAPSCYHDNASPWREPRLGYLSDKPRPFVAMETSRPIGIEPL